MEEQKRREGIGFCLKQRLVTRVAALAFPTGYLPRNDGRMSATPKLATEPSNFRIATPALALLSFAFQRLANREQEDGTLVLCVR